MERAKLISPPQTSGFHDTDGFNDRPPGRAILLAAWYTYFESKELWLHHSQQLVGGVNVADDESHKLVKSIRVDHSKVFHGVYTLVNEYNHVVLQVRRFCQNAFFVHDGSRALCQSMSVAVAHGVDAGIRPMRWGEGVGQTRK